MLAAEFLYYKVLTSAFASMPVHRRDSEQKLTGSEAEAARDRAGDEREREQGRIAHSV